MKGRKRLWWLVVGVVALGTVGVTILFSGGEEDLAFLNNFRYTLMNDEEGTDYRIYGDRIALVAAIPGAATAKPRIDAKAIQYSFRLPSGRYAVLTFSKIKPNRPAMLSIDGAPPPWYYRALHRLGLV
jgi:hypothetical protein